MGSSESKKVPEIIKYDDNKTVNKQYDHQLNISNKSSIDADMNMKKNSVICIENTYYSKNNNIPPRLTRNTHKHELNKIELESKMFKHELRRRIRQDCLKNILKNENDRKQLIKLSQRNRKHKAIENKLSKVNLKYNFQLLKLRKNSSTQMKKTENKIIQKQKINEKLIKDEKRHLNAFNNHKIFINKRVNKLKLHNFIVKQRSNRNNNIISIKVNDYSQKSAPERLLRICPFNNTINNLGYERKKLQLNKIRDKAAKYNNYLKIRYTLNNSRQYHKSLILKRKLIYKHKFVTIRKSLNTFLRKSQYIFNNRQKINNQNDQNLLTQLYNINLNKHIINKKLLNAKKVSKLHQNNWLISNIKDRKMKANKNRIEIFEFKDFNKLLPISLLNNIRIKTNVKTQSQRVHSANIRRENLIDIIKQKCIESREFFNLKRKFIDQNSEINKAFKIYCFNYKFKMVNFSKNQKLSERNEIRTIKNDEIQAKKYLYDQKKQLEIEQKNLKMNNYYLKIKQQNKNKENILSLKQIKNENRSKKINDFKTTQLCRIKNMKDKIENKNKIALENYNKILSDKINKLHIHNDAIKSNKNSSQKMGDILSSENDQKEEKLKD